MSASGIAPSPTPSASEHTIAFDGDCASVLSAEELAAIIGAQTPPTERGQRSANGIGTLGGLECSWIAPNGGYLLDEIYAISVVVLPTASISDALRVEASNANCITTYDSASCTLGADFDGVWVSASSVQVDDEAPTALLQKVLDAASAHVPGAIRPVPMPVTANWWPTTLACEELGQRLGLADFLGADFITGWWEGDPTKQWLFRVGRDAGVDTSCMWYPNSESGGWDTAQYGLTSLRLYPGAGWDREGLLGEGERIELPSGGLATVDGTNAVGADDVNAASVSIGYSGSGDPTELLARVFAVMDEMR